MDSETEHANQTLESILQAFVDQCQSNWDLLLSSAELPPRVPASLLQPQSSVNPTVQEFLDEQSATLILAKEAIENCPTSKLSAHPTSAYRIVEQHTPVSFCLELPPQMKIHDIFHVDRFHPHQPSPEPLGQCTPARPPPDIINGQEEYEPRFPWEDATWEPASHLTNSPWVLQKYKHENGI
ncbi:hypothetical protein BGZ98_002501 [Dissophora globulifera]|nr:hypothetical protein BGZ98_002501 [Dissophora globulifera]